ncbi:MAG TPA: hypothetical protein DEP38_24315 [Cyanobacteria bacterium UBA9226]|nr:hypothetical protein [Cyanobacteria bacterium UBA9226]
MSETWRLSPITSIDRTAYPQFKTLPSAKELAELYTPTQDEIRFGRSQVRTSTGMLALMVMLKSFQRLGYFVDPESVPTAIIAHVRKCLNFSGKVAAIPSVRSRRYYQQAIRVYQKIGFKAPSLQDGFF